MEIQIFVAFIFLANCICFLFCIPNDTLSRMPNNTEKITVFAYLERMETETHVFDTLLEMKYTLLPLTICMNSLWFLCVCWFGDNLVLRFSFLFLFFTTPWSKGTKWTLENVRNKSQSLPACFVSSIRLVLKAILCNCLPDQANRIAHK